MCVCVCVCVCVLCIVCLDNKVYDARYIHYSNVSADSLPNQ